MAVALVERGKLRRCEALEDTLIDDGEAGDWHAIADDLETEGAVDNFGTRGEAIELIKTAVGNTGCSCPICDKYMPS